MSRCEENANGQAWDSQWDHRMEKVCKLILVGNGSVGKTSICQRFKDDGFLKVYRQTIGVDFLEKKLELR
jgi:GTPase SAR1 family protein